MEQQSVMELSSIAMDDLTIDFEPEASPGARLLVIDDQPEMTAILEELGQEAGYEVRTAHRLAEIQSVYDEFKPTVILLDLSLGEGGLVESSAYADDGLEVLKLLSEWGCTAKIFIVSGMSRRKRELTQLQGQKLNLSVIGHISKPFNVDSVEELLVKARSRR